MSALSRKLRLPRQRRSLLLSLLAIAVILVWYYQTASQALPTEQQVVDDGIYRWRGWPQQQVGRERASWGALKQVGARKSIKENLKPDMKYLMSFTLSGWNNQVIDSINNIYLASKAGRVPIVVPFYPHYVHYDETLTPDLPFGRVFDLKRVSEAMENMPIVEAYELKRIWAMEEEHAAVIYDGEVPRQKGYNGTTLELGRGIAPEPLNTKEDEILGCWNYYANFGGEGSAPMERFGLDIQYTPLPVDLFPGGHDTNPIDLFQVAELLKRPHTSSIPEGSRKTFQEYPQLWTPTVNPDDHLACIDTAYWMQTDPIKYNLHGEWRGEIGVWAAVGKHVHFRQGLQDLASAALRDLLGLEPGEEIPPIITIHIRRGDFGVEWHRLTAAHYAHLAQAVRTAIWREKGIRVDKIVVATDEESPVWLEQLRSFGFYLTQDYVAWREHVGDDQWLPIVLDSVILSRGLGFLGPIPSTMSIVSYLRVREWNKGIARFMEPHYRIPEDWTWSWDLEK